MKAFLLAAGRGERFRPVTAAIPKPLLPFLNVPLVRAHLARLRRAGVDQAGVNLHHLGDQIESCLRQQPGELPQLQFFWEPRILGTAGALRNAARWLQGEDFLVVNADAAIAFEPSALFAAHRHSRAAATLLVVDNREPHRYTPLQPEGDSYRAIRRRRPNPAPLHRRVRPLPRPAAPDPAGRGLPGFRSLGTAARRGPPDRLAAARRRLRRPRPPARFPPRDARSARGRLSHPRWRRLVRRGFSDPGVRPAPDRAHRPASSGAPG